MTVTVWCVCNGEKYTAQDVLLLRGMVARNLGRRFDFWCLADRQIPGIDCLIPDEQWPGWWAKISLFRYARTGRHLYLDLDSVVIGALDELLSERLSAPANWAQSGHGGIQSSVMAWGSDYGWIAQAFDASRLHPHPDHPHGQYAGSDMWGDQGFLTHLLGDPGAGEVVQMRGVYSFKYHCQGGPPPDARVVQFHGEPKPGNVGAEWVRRARSSTPI